MLGFLFDAETFRKNDHFDFFFVFTINRFFFSLNYTFLFTLQDLCFLFQLQIIHIDIFFCSTCDTLLVC